MFGKLFQVNTVIRQGAIVVFQELLHRSAQRIGFIVARIMPETFIEEAQRFRILIVIVGGFCLLVDLKCFSWFVLTLSQYTSPKEQDQKKQLGSHSLPPYNV